MPTTVRRRSFPEGARAFLLIATLAITAAANAQSYWVDDLGSGGNDHIADVQVDADGSIYVTGEFGGTVEFGGGSYASAGGIDFFIARLDADGQVVWFKQGGGVGIDRGLKVALGTGTVLAITGEFLGTATFQAQSMTSAGGTADMFVAVLNKSDGSLQWMRQGGGTSGTDRPSGVSIAANGSVCVAGEFRGTASWDGNTLTSMTDPSTSQPSADVFVASYTSAGVLSWIKKGTAKYADRAVDVVHDPLGNIFVTGQFSDTITFAQTHTNALLNASFLMRFDAQGNEVWFRRFGGASFNHVRDLVLAPDGRLLFVGDVQGNMVWSGPPAVNVPGGSAFAYYLLAVGTDGQLLTQGTTGSENGVGVSALSVAGSDIAVLGWFNCQFTDLADHYGATGLFMASGTEDLFVARHNASTFALSEAQQFGGRSVKSPGAVAHLGPAQVVFSGSFQQELIFPALPGFTADMTTGTGGIVGNGVATYCTDTNYGFYTGSLSAGLTDGFVARGYVEGREPYDWWRRTGTGCDRSDLEPCVRSGQADVCPDTITTCGPTILNVNTRYSHAVNVNSHYLGPPITYLWSSGSTNASIPATTTGWYWCTTSTVNGCWQWTDSVYVVVNAPPALPQVSDDVVQNTATTNPQTITLCHPETHWVWSPNASVGTSYNWTDPFGVVVNNDSIVVDTTGSYTFALVGANGCIRYVDVEVIDNPSPEMPDLGLDLGITFDQDTDLNDTLELCPGSAVEYTFIPNWSISGLPDQELPDGLIMTWSLAPLPPTNPGSGEEQSGQVSITGPGWYVLNFWIRVVNAPCGVDTLEFFETDSIYVDVFGDSSVDVLLSGPTVLCDGDTTFLVASCTGCDTLSWTGNGVLFGTDSLQVSDAGTYIVSGSATDGNGCSFADQETIVITMPTGPLLDVDPDNAIICPNSSATLSTTSVGTSYIWYGPQGPITGQGASLTTTVPGEYYLDMIIDGCPVTSNNVDLTNYGTPYLDIQPATVLCGPGDEIQLQVMAAPDAVVQWAPPINGSALSVSITQAGTYSVSVTSCGIVTPLSVVVTDDPAVAAITTPGPYILCEGESVTLHASAGNTSYTWMPGSVSGTDLLVTSGGSYSVIVENAGGCTDTSAVIVVDQVLFAGPLSITGDTVCAGDAAQLTSSGPGPVRWYADASFTSLLGTGAALTFTPTADMTVFARQEESGCIGDSAIAFVDVKPRPAPIDIEGPAELCAGEPLTFSVIEPDTVTLTWSTPQGPFSGDVLTINAVTVANTGTYQCQASYEGCNSVPAVQSLIVYAPQEPSLPPLTEFCIGSQASFTLPEGYTSVQWSTGSSANSITVGSSAVITVTAQDANGCAVTGSLEVIAEDCPLLIPNVFSPNGDGVNDAWFPSGGFLHANAWIYGRWGNLVHEGDVLLRGWDGTHQRNGERCPEGVYYFVLELPRADGAMGRHSGHIQLVW